MTSVASEQKLTGLTNKAAEDLIKKQGYNILPEYKISSPLWIFLQQFLNPFIYILLVAAIVSLFLKETDNAIFIFVVLFINAAIGSIQEYSSEKAALALKKIVPRFGTVIRDGKIVKIPSKNIVVGDLMILTSGDKISADVELVDSHNLTIDESMLTGESLEVLKNAATIEDNTVLEECCNRVFAGTVVTKGRGRGIVIATGINTQIGDISKAISAKDVIKPPLLLRIESFTLKITWIIVAIIALLLVVFLIKGQPIIEIFFIAIALAIAAIPEGLPAAITIALAVGMKRMANKNVIVRKLIATESLGSCTFIASDKTGTLTVNELTIKKIILPNNDTINIDGLGLEIKKNEIDAKYKSQITRLCKAGILANEAELEIRNNKLIGSRGDMVDVAFLILGTKYQLDKNDLIASYPKIDEIPYESENGYCGSIHKHNNAKYVFVKGSAEKVVNMCSTMSSDDKDLKIDVANILKQEQELAKQGYRVLAVAQAVNDSSELSNLTFLGLVAMIDPIREEVKPAIKFCKSSNISVAMVTGDHPATAATIARECGIIEECDNNIITGKEIKEASLKGASYLNAIIAKSRVFARISPTQKKDIVESLSNSGHFVAVTGDGVNDAPALKQAHVGVAMGKSGSDVAKEAADIILVDDNFSSIVEGIKQGRIIYNNIRKVIFLLITTGFSEVVLFLLSILFNLPMPLIAVQLLWLNLVTNGVQDIALAFEPEEGDELRKPPRSPDEKIFNPIMIKRLLIDGFVIAVLAFLTFKFLIDHGKNIEEARNITLLLMVLFENIHALNSRSERGSIFKISFFSNPLLIGSIIAAQAIHVASMYIPFLSNILQTSPVSFNSWMLLLAVAMTLMVVDELYKLWIRKGSKNLVLNITSIKTSNKSIDQPAQEITNIYDNQDG